MSTRIRDSVCEGDVHFLRGEGDIVEFRGQDSGRNFRACMDRTDLLAAVATECDAIVIPRADLPEVKTRPAFPGVVYIGGGMYSLGIPDARGLALEYLALAEYRATHPSVDEAQVEGVLGAVEAAGLGEEWADPNSRRDFARRLVARGVRVDLP